MNIAIHAGHAVVGSRGACKYMDEVKKNRLLKKYMIKFFKKEKGVTVKDVTVHTGTQRQVLNGIRKNFSKKCKKGNWLNVSLHLNSSDNWRANGFEILVTPKCLLIVLNVLIWKLSVQSFPNEQALIIEVLKKAVRFLFSIVCLIAFFVKLVLLHLEKM